MTRVLHGPEDRSRRSASAPPTGATVGQRVALGAKASSGLPVSYSSANPGACPVSGSTVTPAEGGTCTITASQAGNDNYAPAQAVKKSFAVARLRQTIDFPQPPDVAFGKPVILSAKASSGLPVSFGTGTPDVCTVSGATVTTTTVGTCRVTASQAGDARYAPVRGVARSFQVERATQTITFTPPDGAAIGQPVTLSASASSGLPVTYRTDNSPVCTVSGLYGHPGQARHLHDHRLPGRQRQVRGSTRRAAVLPRPPRPATTATELRNRSISRSRPARPSAGRSPCPPQPPRGWQVSFSSGHAVGVHGLRRHGHHGHGRHLRRHRLPGRRRPLRARPATCSGPSRSTPTRPRETMVPARRRRRRSSSGRRLPRPSARWSRCPPAPPQGCRCPSAPTPRRCARSPAPPLPPPWPGTCAVTASQAGDSRYLAAHEIAQSFPVHAGHRPQTITFPPPPEATVGDPVTLSASASSGLDGGVPLGHAADLHGLGFHGQPRRGGNLHRHRQPGRQRPLRRRPRGQAVVPGRGVVVDPAQRS